MASHRRRNRQKVGAQTTTTKSIIYADNISLEVAQELKLPSQQTTFSSAGTFGWARDIPDPTFYQRLGEMAVNTGSHAVVLTGDRGKKHPGIHHAIAGPGTKFNILTIKIGPSLLKSKEGQKVAMKYLRSQKKLSPSTTPYAEVVLYQNGTSLIARCRDKKNIWYVHSFKNVFKT